MAALLLLVVVGERSGWLIFGGSDLRRYDGQTFRVVEVIDGDTLDLAVYDGDRPTTRVRLWGIDTPELARPARPAEPWADAARRSADRWAFDRRVTLRLEPHRVRDRFGRLLAYVDLNDGTVLNERLLSEGLAEADARWPHRDLERYARLQEQARRAVAGRWGPAEAPR